MSGRGSKGSLLNQTQKLRAGINKHLAGKTLLVNDKDTKVADIDTTLAGFETQVAATAAINTQWKKAVAAQRANQTDNITPLVVSVSRLLRGMYGASNPILADFGITPASTKPRTAANKAASAVKSKSTRQARGTMGKRQKAKIHGAPATPSTPSVTPAAGTGGAPTK